MENKNGGNIKMTQEEINEILNQLNWNNDEITRYKVIQRFYEEEDLKFFLRPKEYGKEVWDGCAELLTCNHYNLLPYLNELFEWLSDEDNPGFFRIHEKLQAYTYEEVEQSYLYSVQKSKQNRNKKWLEILEQMHFEHCDDIQKEIRNLSWDETHETQEKAIKKLSKVTDLTYFLQNSGKDTWENCARILLKKSDEELIPYLKELFEWLQDMNWPGFYIIKYRLEKFPFLKVKKIYMKCLHKAKLNINTYNTWFAVLQNMHFRKNNIKKDCKKQAL